VTLENMSGRFPGQAFRLAPTPLLHDAVRFSRDVLRVHE